MPIPGTDRAQVVTVPQPVDSGALEATEAGRRILACLPGGEPADLLEIENAPGMAGRFGIEGALGWYSATLEDSEPTIPAAGLADRFRPFREAARRLAGVKRWPCSPARDAAVARQVEGLLAAFQAADPDTFAAFGERWTERTGSALSWWQVELAVLESRAAVLEEIAEAVEEVATIPRGRPRDDTEREFYYLLGQVWRRVTGRPPAAPGGEQRLAGRVHEAPFPRFVAAVLAELPEAIRPGLFLADLDDVAQLSRPRTLRPRRTRKARAKAPTTPPKKAPACRRQPESPLDRAMAVLVAAGGPMQTAELYDELGLTDPEDQFDLLDAIDKAPELFVLSFTDDGPLSVAIAAPK